MLGKTRLADLEWIASQVEHGVLHPFVVRTFDLDHVREAVRFAEQGGVSGKVVLTTRFHSDDGRRPEDRDSMRG